MTRSTLALGFLVHLAALAPAQADLWKRASEPPDPTTDVFNALMQQGDDAATEANAQSLGTSLVLRQVDIALGAYRGASRAKPRSAEPWFRIASVLDSFFFDGCDSELLQHPRPKSCNAPGAPASRNARARELLEAWDTFEAISPLDPRVNEVLYKRAILRTKLLGATTQTIPLLRAVTKDYEALLDRQDGLTAGRPDGILGNLAETYLMLGDIDRAIDTYRQAIRGGGGVSTIYGFAVALDRDGRGDQALGVIRSQGIEGAEEFEKSFNLGAIFFVPTGEEEYYFALAAEAFGNNTAAAEHWRAFISSGAHPQYHPRAKEHLDKLSLRNSVRIKVPLSPDFGRDLVPRSPLTPQRPRRP